jgi:trigger factor
VTVGTVHLVGAGPGDPDLLTLKAARLIETADVVLVDSLVSGAIRERIDPGRIVDVGKKSGDTFRVELPKEHPAHSHQGHQHDHDHEERLYEVRVNDVKERDLPPVDEAFVRRATENEFEDPEAFRDEIRRQLQESFDEQAREMVQGEIIDKMLELHPVPVPESVIESYLDSFVKQVEEENDGEMPDDFDEEHFRNRNRRDAEKQGRWMLIRDKIIEEEDIEVSDEELQEFFTEQAEGDDSVSAQQIEQFYRQMPRMMDRVKQQVLSDKVYDLLIERFDVQKKSREEFQEEMEEQHRSQQTVAP